MDNLSSAHLYLRLKTGESWTSIPKDLLEDCAQLTKANSIEGSAISLHSSPELTTEGNKKDNITIIYTPWSNLRKDASMATGQVSFHDQKMVKKVHVPARRNPIVNRLNKTREEKYPDLRAEKETEDAKKRKAERLKREDVKAKDREEKRHREQLKWEKGRSSSTLLNFPDVTDRPDCGQRLSSGNSRSWIDPCFAGDQNGVSWYCIFGHRPVLICIDRTRLRRTNGRTQHGQQSGQRPEFLRR